MDEDERFVMTFPAYLIGQPPAVGESHKLIVWNMGDIPALMVFTESIFAERMIDYENIPGGIFVAPKREHLAELLRRHRGQFQLVLVDPDPATKKATACNADDFLSQLET